MSSYKSKIKIALLGLGRAGKFHIQSIQAIPDLRLIHVVDKDQNRAQEVGESNECDYSTDYESVLYRSDVDGVIIATPTHEHFKQVKDFLSAGIPVFSEKPLGYSIDEIDNCFDLAHKQNQPLFVGFNRRFDPTFSSLAQQVQSGCIGTPQMIRVTSRDSPLPTMEYIKHSNGIFHDCIVLDFDMLRYITKEDPIEVYAVGSNFVEGIKELNDYDNVLVSLKYESGLIASIDVNRFSAYGYDQRIEVFGNNGMLQAQNRSSTSTILSNDNGLIKPKIEYSFPTRYREAYRLELESFLSTIRDSVEAPISHHDVKMSHILCELGEKSCRNNRPERVR